MFLFLLMCICLIIDSILTILTLGFYLWITPDEKLLLGRAIREIIKLL
jgi:hypothetical protein